MSALRTMFQRTNRMSSGMSRITMTMILRMLKRLFRQQLGDLQGDQSKV
jgi:hypothetical protein